MRCTTRALLVIMAVVGLGTGLAGWAGADSDQPIGSERPSVKLASVSATPNPVAINDAYEWTKGQYAAFLDAMYWRDVTAWAQAWEAGQARLAAEEAARRVTSYAPRNSSAQRPSAPASTGGGGNCGGNWAIPAYIVERESGCSYTTQNSSGAYGAYQIMPEHWNGGACSDLDRSPAGQDACASRLWNDGAGASNWSQTL